MAAANLEGVILSAVAATAAAHTMSEPVRPLGKSFTRIYNTPSRNCLAPKSRRLRIAQTRYARVRVEVKVRFRDLGASF